MLENGNRVFRRIGGLDTGLADRSTGDCFGSLSGMEDQRTTDLVDYSEDPLAGQTVFVNPNPASSRYGTPISDGSLGLNISDDGVPTDIALPYLGLDVPPLSPGTAFLLAASSPVSLPLEDIPSPPFDPPILNDEPRIPAPLQINTQNPPRYIGPKPLGCFGTPVVHLNPSRTSAAGSATPLSDHPSAPRTKKQKARCVRAIRKDTTVTFTNSPSFEDTMAIACTVLVGHVRGRTFSADRLTLWVKKFGELCCHNCRRSRSSRVDGSRSNLQAKGTQILYLSDTGT